MARSNLEDERTVCGTLQPNANNGTPQIWLWYHITTSGNPLTDKGRAAITRAF
jgi:hypothetical protein